jgi:tetratricopeptide (TPR) repeat protein
VAKASGEGDEYCHAHDYAVYAYLQLGRDEDARRTMEEGLKVPVPTKLFVGPYALVAMPARYALERSDWKSAMSLPDPTTSFPQDNAQAHFARAMGAIRSGNAAMASRDAEALAGIHAKLTEAKNTYWAREVEVQRLMVAAWSARASGNSAEGLKLMRAAADLEDSAEKHIVTPARMLPARELLGDMLLEEKQPAAALKEYEASRAREPNRYRNFANAALAAEMAGDKAKARENYAKLLELAKKADGSRPELVKAKAYVAQQ